MSTKKFPSQRLRESIAFYYYCENTCGLESEIWIVRIVAPWWDLWACEQ